MRKILALPIAAALVLGITPAAQAAPATPRNFALVCTTGPFKPRVDLKNFDVNARNTQMDADKALYRGLSKATGRQSNYRTDLVQLQWSDGDETLVWDSRGSLVQRRTVPPSLSWNPKKVGQFRDAGLIKKVRMSVVVDRNHNCRSPWVKAN